MTPWNRAMREGLAKQQPADQVEAVISDFFGAAAEPEQKPSEPKEPAPESPKSHPGDDQHSSGHSGGNIPEAIGAAIGGFFGGPLGATAGAAVGGFAADQASKAGSAPMGPGGTITGGGVDVHGAEDQAGQVAEKLQNLAARGIQTRLAPHGRGKVF